MDSECHAVALPQRLLRRRDLRIAILVPKVLRGTGGSGKVERLLDSQGAFADTARGIRQNLLPERDLEVTIWWKIMSVGKAGSVGLSCHCTCRRSLPIRRNRVHWKQH
jgi:hypothetical protein